MLGSQFWASLECPIKTVSTLLYVFCSFMDFDICDIDV